MQGGPYHTSFPVVGITQLVTQKKHAFSLYLGTAVIVFKQVAQYGEQELEGNV